MLYNIIMLNKIKNSPNLLNNKLIFDKQFQNEINQYFFIIK